MILEGVVTTMDDDGSVRVAPMGPEVGEGFRRLILRPFQTSRTYRNLERSGAGVFHVTDDVELIARAAIGQLNGCPATTPAPEIDGRILAGVCRWYAFRVDAADRQGPRAEMSCSVVASGCLREFFGFNRGKHAVLEAAILATRIDLVSCDEVRAELDRLAPLVDKTGGPAEQRAFALLREHVTRATHERGV